MSLDAFRVGGVIATALLAIGADPTTPRTNGLAHGVATAVIDEVVNHAIVPGPALAAPSAGGPVTGASTITSLDATRLRVPMKAALIAGGAADIPSTDALALALATAFVNEIGTFGVASGSGLTATNTPTTPGTVTGGGAITGLNPVRLATPIYDAFADSFPVEPTIMATLALSIATAVTGEFLVFGKVTPVAIVAPAGGGPLVGTLGVT